MTYHNTQSEAFATLKVLTAKFNSCSFSKIGFDKTRLEYMGSCFKNAENEATNEASACFTLIQTYNSSFKKQWRVTFTKL